MKNTGLLLTLIFLSYIIGCKGDQYTESRMIYVESIAIHDEVMPLMGKLMSLQKELKELLSTTNDNPEKVMEINGAISNLESAHTGMMTWMRNLKNIPGEHDHNNHKQHIEQDKTHLTPEEMLVVQKAQKVEISSVRETTLKSIKVAESILKK